MKIDVIDLYSTPSCLMHNYNIHRETLYRRIYYKDIGGYIGTS